MTIQRILKITDYIVLTISAIAAIGGNTSFAVAGIAIYLIGTIAPLHKLHTNSH